MKASLLSYFRWAAWGVALANTGLALPAEAQFRLGNTGTNATIVECVEVITGDSTLLYYNPAYYLTPPACASIRRHAHVTDKGEFQGEVRDYTIATSQLRSRLHYTNGERHGAYESYFANGQLMMRGAFAHGEPTGTWEFWYPNGQPQQTLEWTGHATPRLRIVAYWDSTGQPGVTNGTGQWQGIMRPLNRRYGGPVLNGLPQGIWESRALSSDKLMTTETYEQGLFRGGKALDAPAGMPARYKAHSLLEPLIVDPTAASDQVRLGVNCATLRADQAQMATLREASKMFQKMRIEPARPPMDATSYMHQLLDRLNQTNQRNAWETMTDGQEFILRATVGDEGTLRLVSGQGGSGIVTALSQALMGMGRWHPATVEGKPAASEVRFIIMKRGTQLHIKWSPERPTVSIPKPVPAGPG